jgi:hypothetical protein
MLDPVAVIVVNELPAKIGEGVTELREGVAFTGAVIVKMKTFDVPPFGGGLRTEICAVPALAISPAASDTDNVALFSNVVGLAEPFHNTVAPGKKLLPSTSKLRKG